MEILRRQIVAAVSTSKLAQSPCRLAPSTETELDRGYVPPKPVSSPSPSCRDVYMYLYALVPAQGGGVFIDSDAVLVTFSSCSIYGNYAKWGAGVYANNNNVIYIYTKCGGAMLRA